MISDTAWSSSLSDAAANLEKVSIKLQDHFEDLSSEYVTDGKRPIPDPVDLLRRIRALEVSTQAIQIECKSMVQKKETLAREVTQLLCTNASSIQTLSQHVGVIDHDRGGGNEDIGGSDRLSQSVRDLSPTSVESQCQNLLSTPPHTTQKDTMQDYYGEFSLQDCSMNEVFLDTSTNSIGNDRKRTMEISDEMFMSLPLEVRKNVNIDHVRQILSLIHEEYTARYMNGYRGKCLSIERFQLLKHRNPVLYKVIANTTTWRGTVSVLQHLGLLRIEKDGLLNLLDFKEEK